MCGGACCHAVTSLTHNQHRQTPTRDKELHLQLEEEQRKEKAIHRRDAALKDKLAAEARVRTWKSGGGTTHVM